MKIDVLKKNYDQAMAKKERMAERISAIESELEQKKKAADELAAQGDEDGYIAAKHEIDDLGYRLFVLKRQTVPKPVTPEDAAAAWAEYTDSVYIPELNKRRSSFEKGVRNLAANYQEMVVCQNKALQMRELLASLTDQNAEDFPLTDEIQDKDALPIRRDIQMKGPEFRFFTGLGAWQCDGTDAFTSLPHFKALDTINSVVRLHKSVLDPQF